MEQTPDDEFTEKTGAQISGEKEIHSRHLRYRDSTRGMPHVGRYPAHWSPTKVDKAAEKWGKVSEFFAEKRRERERGQ